MTGASGAIDTPLSPESRPSRRRKSPSLTCRAARAAAEVPDERRRRTRPPCRRPGRCSGLSADGADSAAASTLELEPELWALEPEPLSMPNSLGGGASAVLGARLRRSRGGGRRWTSCAVDSPPEPASAAAGSGSVRPVVLRRFAGAAAARRVLRGEPPHLGAGRGAVGVVGRGADARADGAAQHAGRGRRGADAADGGDLLPGAHHRPGRSVARGGRGRGAQGEVAQPVDALLRGVRLRRRPSGRGGAAGRRGRRGVRRRAARRARPSRGRAARLAGARGRSGRSRSGRSGRAAPRLRPRRRGPLASRLEGEAARQLAHLRAELLALDRSAIRFRTWRPARSTRFFAAASLISKWAAISGTVSPRPKRSRIVSR